MWKKLGNPVVQKIRKVWFLPEMEVTEIILAKILGLCQLSSHIRGFFSRLYIFKSIGPFLWISLAHNTLTCDIKMLLKVVYDKTA
jgi:hypothetical protein